MCNHEGCVWVLRYFCLRIHINVGNDLVIYGISSILNDMYIIWIYLLISFIYNLTTEHQHEQMEENNDKFICGCNVNVSNENYRSDIKKVTNVYSVSNIFNQ